MFLKLFKQHILGWILIVAYSIVAFVGTLLTLGRFNDSFGRQMIRSWGRTMLWCCDIKLKVEGLEHIGDRRNRVLLYNHESMLDIFIIAALLCPGGVLIVKKEFKYVPFLGWALYVMGFIFLDRKKRAVAKASMETAAKRVVRRNLSPVIAPEGTRSPPDSLLPFKKGAFHLALQSSSPIVPMLIYKAGSHWPRTGYYCRRSGTLRVRFLAPIELEAENPDELQSDVDKIRGRFLEELGQ